MNRRSIDQIRSTFGHEGLTDYSEAYGRKGAIPEALLNREGQNRN